MTNNPDFQTAVNSIYGLGGFAVLVIAIIVIWVVKMSRGRPLPTVGPQQHTETEMAPVLAASLLEGDMFHGLSGKTPRGQYFTYIISGLSLFSSQPTTGMYAVELPYKSGAHLVGLPKDVNKTVDVITGTMEPVVLEGDYPNYFDLYADKNSGSHTQYVLDPAAMMFTVDFCREYQWEILDDTLFFISAGVMPNLELVDTFIEQIRPAVEIPSDRRKNPYKMSYVGTSVRTMSCPICHEQLVASQEWMSCPKQHGYLVTGSQLSSLRRADKGAFLSMNDISRLRPEAPRKLTCPYCLNPMNASQFAFTPVLIDICSRCMYRWVDSNETSVVFGEDPRYRTSA